MQYTVTWLDKPLPFNTTPDAVPTGQSDVAIVSLGKVHLTIESFCLEVGHWFDIRLAEGRVPLEEIHKTGRGLEEGIRENGLPFGIPFDLELRTLSEAFEWIHSHYE